jgi:hypothetical protein
VRADVVKLFRPTGQIELALVFAAKLRAWPARLPDQPIFYPVLNLGYAIEIASKWNTKTERRVGYVTEFDVEPAYASRFDRQVVGSSSHEELWVPAEQLDEFNEHLVGPIRVVAAFFGDGFVGHVPEHGPLRGLNAQEQYSFLESASGSDVAAAARENATAVFLHVPRWEQFESSTSTLNRIRKSWREMHAHLPLPSAA